jgi:DNA-binding transcriptional regulator YiaG
VRRSKEDIREIQGGFPQRRVVQISIDGLPENAPELKLSRLLDQYRQAREQRLENETKRKQAASGLLITGLQQRLLSSIEAFARTLKVHRRTVQRQWEKLQTEANTETEVLQPVDLLTGSIDYDDDRATLEEEQLQAEEDAQFEAASAATIGPTQGPAAETMFAHEQQLLEEMTEIAEQARGQNDARTEKLIEWIRAKMCPDLGKPGAKWNDVRVLIFTEYDDTKRYLVSRLDAALAGSDQAESRVQVFHGPTPPAKREEIKQAFSW